LLGITIPDERRFKPERLAAAVEQAFQQSNANSSFPWWETNRGRSRSPWIAMWWATPCAIVTHTASGDSTSGRCSLKAVYTAASSGW